MLKGVEPLSWRGWLIGSALSLLLFGAVPWLLTDDKGTRIFLPALGLGIVLVLFFQGLYERWRDRRTIRTLRQDVSAGLVEETRIELTRIAAVCYLFDLHYIMEVGANELAFLPSHLAENPPADGPRENVDVFPKECISIVRAPQTGSTLAVRSQGKSIAPCAIYTVVKYDRPGQNGLPLHGYQPFPGRLEQLPVILKEQGVTIELAKEQAHA